jgi:hypothetical protein
LRVLDEAHVPPALRRVVAASGKRLPPPLERGLVDHLDRFEWLREKALEQLRSWGDPTRDEASTLFLTRTDGWERRIEELADVRDEVGAERSLDALDAANARLNGRVIELRQELQQARDEVEQLRQDHRSDADRDRLAAANRELRGRIDGSDRAVSEAQVRIRELELLLAEADRRILELRRRTQTRAGRPEGSSFAPQVFGVGDPLALAISLDHLIESLARSGEGREPEAVSPAPALPAGTRPDQAPAVDWLLSIARPLTVLIDGYNVGHELGPTPNAIVRSRVEQVGARLRRMAEGALTVVVYWDSVEDSAGWRSSGVDVRYVHSADDAIISHAGPGTVVITSDRAVREAAEAKGAIGLWSQALLSWMQR